MIAMATDREETQRQDEAIDPLKLHALDSDDLAVISAHLQHAQLRIADLAYLPNEQRFALCVGRYEWEHAPEAPRRRRLTGLHFERVLGAQMRNLDPRIRETALELIAIGFEPGDAPSGAIILFFADDRALRLEVECIEAQMRDMGPVWEADPPPPIETEEDE
jgi:hypothetical protein